MKFPSVLLLGICFLANADAQQRQPHALNSTSIAPTGDVAVIPSTERFKSHDGKTRSGSIYMRYVNYLAAEEGISQASLAQGYKLNFMFPDSAMRYNPPYQGYGISYSSVAQVLNPQSPIITSWLSPNDIIITNSNSYTIDSVWIGSSYVKYTSAIDSMKISLVNSGGNNLPGYYFTGPVAQNYLTDTVYFEVPTYNPVNFHRAHQSTAAAAPVAYVSQRALTSQDSSTYVVGSNLYYIKYIGFSGNNFAVPAGEHVAVSFTFLPGFSWSSGDTIGHNNHLLFASHEPNGPNTFMPYYGNERNMSYTLTKDSTGWSGMYIPTVAFTSAAFQPEVHDIIWKISCTTCANLNPTNVDTEHKLNTINFLPNPNQGVVNLSLDMASPASRLLLTICNIQGQVLKKIDMSSSAQNSHINRPIDLQDLASGIYIYTLEVDNEKYCDKITIR